SSSRVGESAPQADPIAHSTSTRLDTAYRIGRHSSANWFRACEQRLNAGSGIDRAPAPLLDELVRSCEQRLRNLQADGLRSFAIEEQLEPRGLHDRELGRPRALENPAGVVRGLS